MLIPAWSRESGPDMPQRVTYTKLQRLTRAAAYVPVFSFKLMARGYAALEAGDGPRFYDVMRAVAAAGPPEPPPSPVCSLPDTPAAMPREVAAEPDALSAIIASDSRGPRSLDEFQAFVGRLTESSRWLGAVNADFGMGYAGRSVDARWRFSTGERFPCACGEMTLTTRASFLRRRDRRQTTSKPTRPFPSSSSATRATT